MIPLATGWSQSAVADTTQHLPALETGQEDAGQDRTAVYVEALLLIASLLHEHEALRMPLYITTYRHEPDVHLMYSAADVIQVEYWAQLLGGEPVVTGAEIDAQMVYTGVPLRISAPRGGVQ